MSAPVAPAVGEGPVFAIVEQMGHRRFGARIREVTRFGAACMEAHVLTDPPAVTYVFPTSLFAVTICDEAAARRANLRHTGLPELAAGPDDEDDSDSDPLYRGEGDEDDSDSDPLLMAVTSAFVVILRVSAAVSSAWSFVSSSDRGEGDEDGDESPREFVSVGCMTDAEREHLASVWEAIAADTNERTEVAVETFDGDFYGGFSATAYDGAGRSEADVMAAGRWRANITDALDELAAEWARRCE